MSQPERMRMPVSNLLVNPANPRFDPVNDQNQAIQTMLEHEGDSIKKLAQDIIKHGLNPIKSLAVYGQNGKYVVQEGNRRVVALKLLENPDMISDSKLRGFFTRLKDGATIPSNVSCAVFNTPEDAKHWVMLEHTGQNQGIGTVPWNTIQKQRFDNKPSRLVKIVEYIGDSLPVNQVDPSTLDRLISTPYARNKIGIKFS